MAEKNIALVGSPNSGKTTLYNWCTGSHFKTVNYPGSTVDYSRGLLSAHLTPYLPNAMTAFHMVDTPGTYSLFPKSADEEVTLKVLFDLPLLGPVQGVIVVIDGTQLERQLHLALQIKECGFPFVVAVTMADLLEREGLIFDLDLLSRELGAPVVAFKGLLGGGLQELVAQLGKLPDAGEVKAPARELAQQRTEARRISHRVLSQIQDVKTKLRDLSSRTRKYDAILLHPLWGPLCFFIIMTTLFASIYWLAQPLMDAVDFGFTWVADLIRGPGHVVLWRDFLGRGVVKSLGAVLIFVPQIFILFFGIGLLESTGYLARAATLIDRPFSKVGLTGRSFVPILSGFSCAVPAIIATRNLSSRRDRWITSFVIPLMTCSARLPVYALLLGFLFHDSSPFLGGLALAALYIGALLIGGLAASILNRILPRDEGSLLLMELPLYRRPRVKVVLRQALTRTQGYLNRAAPIILVIATLMWFGTNFPGYEMQDPAQKLEQSYAGRVGHFLEPLVKPMGVDWRVGVGLISAFAAREVFVSTMAITMSVANPDEVSQQQSLLKEMTTAKRASDGALIFTTASVWGLILFFMIALQCMSTFAVAQREMGSWSFAFTQLVVFNLFAYGVAVAVVQGLHAFGVR